MTLRHVGGPQPPEQRWMCPKEGCAEGCRINTLPPVSCPLPPARPRPASPHEPRASPLKCTFLYHTRPVGSVFLQSPPGTKVTVCILCTKTAAQQTLDVRGPLLCQCIRLWVPCLGTETCAVGRPAWRSCFGRLCGDSPTRSAAIFLSVKWEWQHSCFGAFVKIPEAVPDKCV